MEFTRKTLYKLINCEQKPYAVLGKPENLNYSSFPTNRVTVCLLPFGTILGFANKVTNFA